MWQMTLRSCDMVFHNSYTIYYYLYLYSKAECGVHATEIICDLFLFILFFRFNARYNISGHYGEFIVYVVVYFRWYERPAPKTGLESGDGLWRRFLERLSWVLALLSINVQDDTEQ